MLSAWPYREKIGYHLPCLSNVYSSDKLWQEVCKGCYSLESIPEHFARPIGLYKNCSYIIMLWEFTSTRSWIANVLGYCARKERHSNYIWHICLSSIFCTFCTNDHLSPGTWHGPFIPMIWREVSAGSKDGWDEVKAWSWLKHWMNGASWWQFQGAPRWFWVRKSDSEVWA